MTMYLAAQGAMAIYGIGAKKSAEAKANLDSCQDEARAYVNAIVDLRQEIKKLGHKPTRYWKTLGRKVNAIPGSRSGGLKDALTGLNKSRQVEGGEAIDFQGGGGWGITKEFLKIFRPDLIRGPVLDDIEKNWIGTRTQAEEDLVPEEEEVSGLGIFGRKRRKKARTCGLAIPVLKGSFEELVTDYNFAKGEDEKKLIQADGALGPELQVAGFRFPIWGIAVVAALSFWTMRRGFA